MLVKLVNISDKNIFDEYSSKYKIFRDLYDPNGEALEFFRLSETQREVLRGAFVNNKMIFYSNRHEDKLLLLGDLNEFNEIANLLSTQTDEELGNCIANTVDKYINYERLKYKINGRVFSNDKISVMGILNVTPDSFSDGGMYNSVDSALKRAKEMIELGVDTIDVGGESTRPGSLPVEADEEIRRVVPVIEKIKSVYPEVIISIDTNKSEVAEKSVENGADIINDISAGTFDDKMFSVAAKYNTPIILMHIKGKPQTMQSNPEYGDLISEVYSFLLERIGRAKKEGVNTIIADPGIGFGKSVADNFRLITRLKEFRSLGVPMLIGLSRKSFLGKSLELTVDERETPTIISETVAALKGARIIRTHNVKNAIYLKKLFDFYNTPELLNANV